MRRRRNMLVSGSIVVAAVIALQSVGAPSVCAQSASASTLDLQIARSSPSDLEVGGELAGLPPGTTRYVTRNELLALPRLKYTVSDDSNFKGPTEISGVSLEELTKQIGAVPGADLVVAISDDKYSANYPRAYIAAHHPLLVLEINGKPPSGWPRDSGNHGFDMGPYMISHPKFMPSFTVLTHRDEQQIPWGVVRLEFRTEKAVLGPITPRGPRANEPAVQAGFKIAQQNCFHCHNMGAEGGQKAGVPWNVLSALASGSPEFFGEYVRNPKAKNPQARMTGNPGYDDATIAALTAYFQTFSANKKP